MKALQIVRQFYPNVVRVRDARRPLDIEVTNSDIKHSTVKSHKSCAIAEACKRLEAIDGAVIAVRVAYLVNGDTAVRYHMPENMTREIVAFDRSGAFQPGSYTLKRPSIRLGDPRGTGSNTRRPSGKRVRYNHVTQNIRKFSQAVSA